MAVFRTKSWSWKGTRGWSSCCCGTAATSPKRSLLIKRWRRTWRLPALLPMFWDMPSCPMPRCDSLRHFGASLSQFSATLCRFGAAWVNSVPALVIRCSCIWWRVCGLVVEVWGMLKEDVRDSCRDPTTCLHHPGSSWYLQLMEGGPCRFFSPSPPQFSFMPQELCRKSEGMSG